MSVTDLIKWRINSTAHSLSRSQEEKGLFVYQRGGCLPQYFTAEEAYALHMQIRRMISRSDFALAPRKWGDEAG